MTSSSKLAELRARTDRQLAAYVQSRLELGRQLVRARAWTAAEAVSSEIARLLPVIYGLSDSERARLGESYVQLREMLETPCLKAS
ncbi:MAG: hypothetical protein C5B51_18105 [Terriglobia bacterium]|nr:MAG: hypothetical protein C5B51_18105 [Terriglobia bacterium]